MSLSSVLFEGAVTHGFCVSFACGFREKDFFSY